MSNETQLGGIGKCISILQGIYAGTELKKLPYLISLVLLT